MSGGLVRLLRVGPAGEERPCVLGEDGVVVDVSGLVDDYDGTFWTDGGADRLREALPGRHDLPVVDLEQERVGACVARPPKVVCIGLNYSDHAAESGLAVPAEPVVFLKASNTVVGLARDRYLRAGDVTELEVTGLGTQRQRLVPAP